MLNMIKATRIPLIHRLTPERLIKLRQLWNLDILSVFYTPDQFHDFLHTALDLIGSPGYHYMNLPLKFISGKYTIQTK